MTILNDYDIIVKKGTYMQYFLGLIICYELFTFIFSNKIIREIYNLTREKNYKLPLLGMSYFEAMYLVILVVYGLINPNVLALVLILICVKLGIAFVRLSVSNVLKYYEAQSIISMVIVALIALTG